MARRAEEHLHRTLKAPYIDPLGDDVWLVRPFFVGRQAAREILEPVYKKTFKDYECKDMSLLRALPTVDAFSAGLTPLPSFVQKLELFGTMGSCGGASTDAGRFHSQESREQGFELLRRLPETELCELKVRIVDIGTDNIVRVGRLLESFRPVYHHLVARGCNVQVLYCSYYCMGSSELRVDLTRYIGVDEGVWRGELEKEVEEWRAERDNDVRQVLLAMSRGRSD
jgi:hypothetical protein